MNIYFILFGFIILYMFKIMCNRIEGMVVCGNGCMPVEVYERQMRDLGRELNEAVEGGNNVGRQAAKLRDKLLKCNQDLSNCRS